MYKKLRNILYIAFIMAFLTIGIFILIDCNDKTAEIQSNGISIPKKLEDYEIIETINKPMATSAPYKIIYTTPIPTN